MPLPASIDETLGLLAKADYIADRSLATVLYLSLRMGRPLFLEGEAGVGKTEIARVLAKALQRRLIRLQCYEGLDVSAAVYEWNYGAQMIAIRLAEAEGEGDRARIEHDVFSERFLIKRPLLQALEPDPDGPPVLLPMTWLVIVTMTASYQKIFSGNPRIGFLAQANALAAQIASGKIPAASIGETQRVIFNLRLDAGVTAVLAGMILVLVIEAALQWYAILSQRKVPVLQETPYVATQWAEGD